MKTADAATEAALPNVVFDADDFCINQDTTYRGENLLEKLKKEIPHLKVTLFAIPAFCDDGFLERWGSRDWVEIAVHGFTHEFCEFRECSRDEAIRKLRMAFKVGPFVKGFKAPNWITSPGLYAALAEEGFWIADHPANANKIPWNVPAYVLAGSHDIGLIHPDIGVLQAHCHTHNVCGNGIAERYEDLLALRDHEFLFVSEIVRPRGDKSSVSS